eukprot:SAG31_NODE_531_length_14413_cov_7.712659_10_plen_60_part_00
MPFAVMPCFIYGVLLFCFRSRRHLAYPGMGVVIFVPFFLKKNILDRALVHVIAKCTSRS